MGADIDVFFLEFSFFTSSTEDVSRDPTTISVKHEGQDLKLIGIKIEESLIKDLWQ